MSQLVATIKKINSVDNLNIEKVAYIQIPIPPINIQVKIVEEIDLLEKKSKTIVINDLDEQIEKIIKKHL